MGWREVVPGIVRLVVVVVVVYLLAVVRIVFEGVAARGAMTWLVVMRL